VTDPELFVKDTTGHGKATDLSQIDRGGLGFEGFDFRKKFGGKGFVGIDAKDPGMGGEAEDVVFLAYVTFPGDDVPLSVEAGGDFAGPVGALRIHDEDFVGDCLDRVEAALEIGFLVKSNDAEGDLHGGKQVGRRWSAAGLVQNEVF